VPEFQDAVPLDPFTGKPLHYFKRDDGTLVIYSVGRDLKDDQGFVEAAPKQVARPTDVGIILRAAKNP